LPPSIVIDSFDFERKQNEIVSALPPRLYFLHRLHKIQTNALGTVVRNGLNLESDSENRALSSLIEVFDSQVQEMRTSCVDDLGLFPKLSAHKLS
jgi:hypothetical protein